jgi:hypothetical protein
MKTLIVLFGREWFDKKDGNSYCDVEIILHTDDKIITHRTEFTNGYGDYYIQLGTEWLSSNNHIQLQKHANGASQPLWQYCRENNIHLITSKTKVKNSKELKSNEP